MHPIDVRRAAIAHHNDVLRRTGQGGRIVVTRSVAARGVAFVTRALAAVQDFAAFTEENDPYGEHDFGQVDVDGEVLLFKIDYYEKTIMYHSPDPSDPTVTTRIMTLMFAEEY
jgi:hypothetical protein